jgi:hypothetical protein
MAQRPQNFRLNKRHGLAKSLVISYLGMGYQTLQAFNSSRYDYYGVFSDLPTSSWYISTRGQSKRLYWFYTVSAGSTSSPSTTSFFVVSQKYAQV